MALERVLVVALGSVLCVSGCARRIYYTHPIREAFEQCAGGPDGKACQGPDQLQYFASRRFVLERAISSRQERLTSGRIVLRKGQLLERVVVRRGTPAVALDWGENWVEVSFEKGTSLVFERHDDEAAPAEDRKPASYFGPKPPSTSYRLRTTQNDEGHVEATFEGRSWHVVGGRVPRLMVKRRSVTRRNKNRRVLRGRRL